MIPILYGANERNFTTDGFGKLNDAISCVVKNEAADSGGVGVYVLTMDYPIDGVLAGEIKKYRIILAKANDTQQTQPFDIMQIEKYSDHFTITAQHVINRLDGMPMVHFPAYPNKYSKLSDAVANMPAHRAYGTIGFGFTVSSGEDVNGEFYSWYQCKTARKIIEEILETYDCEMQADRFNLHFSKQCGANNGAIVKYGKNIVKLDENIDLKETYNSVCDFYSDEDGRTLAISNGFINPDNRQYMFAKLVDRTRDIEEFSSAGDLVRQLNEWRDKDRLTIDENGNISINVDIADLSQSAEYADFRDLEKIGLYDTVRLIHEPLGIDALVRVSAVEYDTLAEKNKCVTLGNKFGTLADTIAGGRKATKTVSQQVTQARQSALNAHYVAAEAQETAETAETTAATASQTATAAQTAASAAQSTANSAQTAAATAQAAAEAAQETADATADYFWHDSNGAHVSDTAGDLTGKHLLLTSSGVSIKDGTAEVASFAEAEIELGHGAPETLISMCDDALKIRTMGGDVGNPMAGIYGKNGLQIIAGEYAEGQRYVMNLAARNGSISFSDFMYIYSAALSIEGYTTLNLNGGAVLVNGNPIPQEYPSYKKTLTPNTASQAAGGWRTLTTNDINVQTPAGLYMVDCLVQVTGNALALAWIQLRMWDEMANAAITESYIENVITNQGNPRYHIQFLFNHTGTRIAMYPQAYSAGQALSCNSAIITLARVGGTVTDLTNLVGGGLMMGGAE